MVGRDDEEEGLGSRDDCVAMERELCFNIQLSSKKKNRERALFSPLHSSHCWKISSLSMMPMVVETRDVPA